MPMTTRKKIASKPKRRRKASRGLTVKIKPKAPRACRTKNRKART